MRLINFQIFIMSTCHLKQILVFEENLIVNYNNLIAPLNLTCAAEKLYSTNYVSSCGKQKDIIFSCCCALSFAMTV